MESSANRRLYQHTNHKQAQRASSFHHQPTSTPAIRQATRHQLRVQQSQDSGDSPDEWDDEQPTSSGQDQDSRHRVGPVMGIFFKVWSLVKVTKGRQQSRTRRQISEEPADFHYSSTGSDQLTHPSQYKHTAILQDRHFRRAGSQPAPSLSSCSPPAGNRLQVRSAGVLSEPVSQPSGSQSPTATAASGTTSSSSGVSSASSSAVAGHHQRQLELAKEGGVSSVRRHLSAYNLRRATADVAGPNQRTRASGLAPRSSKWSSGASNWATKIKRSATTVNQSDFSAYVSRCRSNLRRDQISPRPKEAPSTPAATSSMGAIAKPKIESLNLSQESDQVTPIQSDCEDPDHDRREVQRLGQSSRVHNQNRKWDSAIQVEPSAADEEGDDATSNDIYSTPNDSIQSVSCGQRALPPTNQISEGGGRRTSVVSDSQCHHPSMHKSFSAYNFEQAQSSQRKLSYSEVSAKTPSAKQETDKMANPKPRQRLNSSRFFISSSSSEDSQSAVPTNAATAGLVRKQDGQTNPEKPSTPGLEMRAQPVILQRGVHSHEPLAGRGVPLTPDSLHLGQRAAATPLYANQPPTMLPPDVGQLGSPLDAQPIGMLAHKLGSTQRPVQPTIGLLMGAGYRKSPSLFEISSRQQYQLPPRVPTRFSSRYPAQQVDHRPALDRLKDSFSPGTKNIDSDALMGSRLPNSISLHDYKKERLTDIQQKDESLLAEGNSQLAMKEAAESHQVMIGHRELALGDEPWSLEEARRSEYKLAEILLECGSNPNGACDETGNSPLMLAILSDNLSAARCLIEHGAKMDHTNSAGDTALDLACRRTPSRLRLQMLALLIDSGADLDRSRPNDGSRLLDRLIGEHSDCNDKLTFVNLLLQNGAKLGSATWTAAMGKHDIQLRLLRKLCQDGYFLYKKSTIEAAVFRFEYALKRIAELEQQLAQRVGSRRLFDNFSRNIDYQSILLSSKQLKYQTYLGLSRCERKRRFYKRALEFANMSILVDSTSYEGHYSKAHILKDIGDIDDALVAIDQTQRLVTQSMEQIEEELAEFRLQEEALIFDGCFNMLDTRQKNHIETGKFELIGNLNYLHEAKGFVSRLQAEIIDEKMKRRAQHPVNAPSDKIASKNPEAGKAAN